MFRPVFPSSLRHRIRFTEDGVLPAELKGGDCMSDNTKSEHSESSDRKVSESCCYVVMKDFALLDICVIQSKTV